MFKISMIYLFWLIVANLLIYLLLLCLCVEFCTVNTLLGVFIWFLCTVNFAIDFCLTYKISLRSSFTNIYKVSNGLFMFCILLRLTCVYISVVLELLCPNNS